MIKDCSDKIEKTTENYTGSPPITEAELERLKSKKKVMSLLGFATKSGNLVTGYNTCLKLIPARKLKLLIIGEDVGENTTEKMKQKCETYNIPVRVFGACEELSHATGKIDKGLFGISDDGFSKSIIKEIDKILSEREVF